MSIPAAWRSFVGCQCLKVACTTRKIQSSSKLQQFQNWQAEIPDTPLGLTGIGTWQLCSLCLCLCLCWHYLWRSWCNRCNVPRRHWRLQNQRSLWSWETKRSLVAKTELNSSETDLLPSKRLKLNKDGKVRKLAYHVQKETHQSGCDGVSPLDSDEMRRPRRTRAPHCFEGTDADAYFNFAVHMFWEQTNLWLLRSKKCGKMMRNWVHVPA